MWHLPPQWQCLGLVFTTCRTLGVTEAVFALRLLESVIVVAVTCAVQSSQQPKTAGCFRANVHLINGLGLYCSYCEDCARSLSKQLEECLPEAGEMAVNRNMEHSSRGPEFGSHISTHVSSLITCTSSSGDLAFVGTHTRAKFSRICSKFFFKS